MTQEDQKSAAIIFIMFLVILCGIAATVDYFTTDIDELRKEKLELEIKQLKNNS